MRSRATSPIGLNSSFCHRSRRTGPLFDAWASTTSATKQETAKRSPIAADPSVLGFYNNDSNLWGGTPVDLEDETDTDFDDDDFEYGLDSALDEVLVPRGWLSLRRGHLGQARVWDMWYFELPSGAAMFLSPIENGGYFVVHRIGPDIQEPSYYSITRERLIEQLNRLETEGTLAWPTVLS